MECVENEGLDINDWYNGDYYHDVVLPKIGRLLQEHNNREFEKRTVYTGESCSLVYPQFDRIMITQRAFDKGKYISKRICELAGDDYEIYLFSIGDRGSDVINDIYIGQRQTVWPDYCMLDGVYSNWDICNNLGKDVLGWAHSHADFTLFHSRIDRDNLFQFTRDWGYDHYVDIFDDDDCLEQKLHGVRYTPSLVFNKHLWGTDKLPFGGVSMLYNKYGSGERVHRINENVNIEVIDSEPFSPEEYAEVDKQIIERVTLHDRGPLKDLVSIDEVSHKDESSKGRIRQFMRNLWKKGQQEKPKPDDEDCVEQLIWALSEKGR